MPRYALEELKKAIRDGRYVITRKAGADAAALSFDEDDIKHCVLGLEDCHFYKSMASRRRPGLSQDVYKSRYLGIPIYTKLQTGLGGQTVVISFKRDESV
jgi:hypothetical protein